MKNKDWSTFTIKAPIKASVQKVYNAWTTQEEMEKWFLRLSEFKTFGNKTKERNEAVTKGDTYTWKWHGYVDEIEKGTILEANGKDFIRFTFGKAGIVNVHIKPHENGSMIELVQEEIPTDEEGKFRWYVGCSTGWTFYLANLNSILQGGVDIRNRDNVLNMM
jgi:uncharacterized protein YndB with AHSA1/START domain